MPSFAFGFLSLSTKGVFQETEGLALAVMILDKKCNTTDDSVARQLQEDESLAEVGMYPVKDDLCRSYMD